MTSMCKGQNPLHQFPRVTSQYNKLAREKVSVLFLALVLGLEMSSRTNFECLALALSKSPWPWANRSLALQDL